MKELWRFLRDEEGPAAPEYAIIAGLIAVVIIGAVLLAGQKIDAVFQAIATAIPGGGGS